MENNISPVYPVNLLEGVMRVSLECSEADIIENAKQCEADGAATAEQKLILKLIAHQEIQNLLEVCFEDMQPLTRETPLLFKETFDKLWEAMCTSFNMLLPYCGNSEEYAFETLFDFIEDLGITKLHCNPPLKCKTSIGILRNLRDLMEVDKYYTPSELNTLLKEDCGIDIALSTLTYFIKRYAENGYFKSENTGKKKGRGYIALYAKTDKPYEPEIN